MPNRRDFLRTSILAGAAGALSGALPGTLSGALPDGGALDRSVDLDAASRGIVGPAPRALRILLLGGTGFIGPHLVKRIVDRGHTLTLFNRGRSEPGMHAELFPALETRVGDRGGDLTSLETGNWDAVIDNSGYTPDEVGATARLLAGRVGQYIFTSTRGVYAGFTSEVMDEDAPVGIAGVPDTEWTGYGPLKALAERDVWASFPEGTSIVRPPIITGPGDNTDRFTFWYDRVDRGGEVMAPGDPSDPIQYVDVRDLADFVVKMAEERILGVYNVTGPAAPLSTAEFLHGLRGTTGNPVRFTWVPWGFLEEHGIRGGAQIAAWRAPTGANLNYGRVSNARALAAGMTFRPLAETAVDTLAWFRERVASGGAALRSGYAAEREAEVLAAWRGRG
jgi:2'-hydroxyisoflavone reductase